MTFVHTNGGKRKILCDASQAHMTPKNPIAATIPQTTMRAELPVNTPITARIAAIPIVPTTRASVLIKATVAAVVVCYPDDSDKGRHSELIPPSSLLHVLRDPLTLIVRRYLAIPCFCARGGTLFNAD